VSDRTLDIGIVTDEVSRDLAEALEASAALGLHLFELREGGARRFPYFSREEFAAVEAARSAGARITAVSPGLFKGAAADAVRLRHEIEEVLPRAIDAALRLGCPLLILFGFERYDGEPEQGRLDAMRAFERAAEHAAGAGMTVALENEPNFWIDRPAPAAALLDEIGHPALRLNWDPANLHWGGRRPTYEDFEAVRPHLANLHVKDFKKGRPAAPWFPVGEGTTPWDEILAWVAAETTLPHVTLETHCEPLLESTRRSLEHLRPLVADALASTP
jgi:sugar phosphate isomerase/epimerase